MGNSSPNRASSTVRPIHANDDSVSSRFGNNSNFSKTSNTFSTNVVSGKLRDFKKGLNRRDTENSFLNFLKSDKLISYTSLLKVGSLVGSYLLHYKSFWEQIKLNLIDVHITFCRISKVLGTWTRMSWRRSHHYLWKSTLTHSMQPTNFNRSSWPWSRRPTTAQ